MLRFYSFHALSVDEHKHSPARMRYSKFVHSTSRTTDTAPMLLFVGLPKVHGFKGAIYTQYGFLSVFACL